MLDGRRVLWRVGLWRDASRLRRRERNEDMLESLTSYPRALIERVSSELAKLDVTELWADSTRKNLEQPALQHDPEFIGQLLERMQGFNDYFDSEVRGFERVPSGQPVLLVGNHSGGTLVPDTCAVISKWYAERGLDDVLVGLAFDGMFGIPGVSTLMRKIGQVPASHENAGLALDQGCSVLVYPGGAHEAFRPWSDRNRIDFDGRKGFIRLALTKQIPVVPVVGHGGHETLIVLSRGEWLARRFGLDRMRATTAPIILQVPWGLSMPALPGIPFPAKVTVECCEPMDWSQYGPEDADDPEVLRLCYNEIVGTMQSTLTRLADENPYPWASRLLDMLP